jgi:hypothetical protein
MLTHHTHHQLNGAAPPTTTRNRGDVDIIARLSQYARHE